MKDKADICFLQESCSTPEVEKIWKSQWKGELFFSHGKIVKWAPFHRFGVTFVLAN